jgi:hypothetical protein
MPENLLAELERFAATLIDAQEALLRILRRKRIALAAADLETISALQPQEAEAARQLQTLVSWRARILQSARDAGQSCETLTELAHALLGPSAGRLTDMLKSAQRLAADVRQESWVQWVITNRCCNFYSEVLELIAQGGKKPPTYYEQAWTHHGGAVLDANA